MSPPSPNQFAYQRALQQRSTPDVGTLWRWVGRNESGQAVIENPRGQRVTARLTGNAAIAPGTPVLYVPPEPGQGFGVVQLPTALPVDAARGVIRRPTVFTFIVGDITWWAVEGGWDVDTDKTRFMSAMLKSANVSEIYLDAGAANADIRLSDNAAAYIQSLGIELTRTSIAEWQGFGFIEANNAIRYSSQDEASILQSFQRFGGIVSLDIGRVDNETNEYIANLFGVKLLDGDPNAAGNEDWEFSPDSFIFNGRPLPAGLSAGGVSSGFDRAENQINEIDVIATSTREGFEGAVLAFAIRNF